MKTKIICAILIGMTMCLPLTGCGEGKAATVETTEETVENAEEAEVETETEAEVEEPVEETDEIKETEAAIEETEAVEEEAPLEEAEPLEETIKAPEGAMTVSFKTEDVFGNSVDEASFQNARLIMLNLWEPWCGPCVREMPDLNALYEEYKDKGLLIIGAYTTFDMDADAKALAEQLGLTYPLIKCNDSIYTLEQDYVPATFLLDGNFGLITKEPYAGSRSYDEWKEIINEYIQ